MKASEVLKTARALAEGNQVAVSLLAIDPILTKLVMTWPSVQAEGLKLDAECPKALQPRLRMRWLFAMLEPDPREAWAEIAGLPWAAHTCRAMFMAIDNKLILPDGTLPRPVRDYVNCLAAQALGGSRKKKGRAHAGKDQPVDK